MSFNEVRLNLGFDFGTVGGASFSTTVLTTGGGYEQRNSNWDEPRGRWQIGDRLYDREQLDYIIRFHRAHRGKAVGFRFRDWAKLSSRERANRCRKWSNHTIPTQKNLHRWLCINSTNYQETCRG